MYIAAELTRHGCNEFRSVHARPAHITPNCLHARHTHRCYGQVGRRNRRAAETNGKLGEAVGRVVRVAVSMVRCVVCRSRPICPQLLRKCRFAGCVKSWHRCRKVLFVVSVQHDAINAGGTHKVGWNRGVGRVPSNHAARQACACSAARQ